jgi:hypothetical protein
VTVIDLIADLLEIVVGAGVGVIGGAALFLAMFILWVDALKE